jgi:methionine synthase I (cobalamin-dependent)
VVNVEEGILTAQFLELLKSCLVLSDGAWGTELQARGLASGDCPDRWNLDHPEHVEDVARSYVRAGSQIILTNTFRSTPIALAGYGLAEKTAEINRAGAEISRTAAGSQALVFASIGPSGRLLATGDVTEQELHDAFQLQAEALAEGGVDGFVVETMADLEETIIALTAALETGLPAVASMSFDSGKQKDRTMMGVTPEQAALNLAKAGATAVGANCGLGIAGLLPICQRMRAVTDLPIWIKANAGLPAAEDGKPVYATSPEEFAEIAERLVEAGANVVGGCCGTSPAYITALAKRLR